MSDAVIDAVWKDKDLPANPLPNVQKTLAQDTTADSLLRGVKFFIKDLPIPVGMGNVRVTYVPVIYDTLHTCSLAYEVKGVMDYYPYGKHLRAWFAGDEERWQTTLNERDGESGLDHRGARAYDSEYGRFLQIDPMAGKFPHLTPYNYTENRPVFWGDPSGNCPECFQEFMEGFVQGFTGVYLGLADFLTTPLDQSLNNAIVQTFGDKKNFIDYTITALSGTNWTIGTVWIPDMGVELLNGNYGEAGKTFGTKVGEASIVYLSEFRKSTESPKTQEPVTNEIYKRPNNATTPLQRQSVQNKPCVDCGAVGKKNVADHITPLVEEHYRTGKIDKIKMRSESSVQPQCPTCSAKQGARLSQYSKLMKSIIQERIKNIENEKR
ncbi:MAG: RHS repeat-associated core domain-containing protein [Bacteroidia bacterium]|nr:RHS repeat-associated core domain-containing protein [Bacteroidia bacterium]